LGLSERHPPVYRAARRMPSVTCWNPAARFGSAVPLPALPVNLPSATVGHPHALTATILADPGRRLGVCLALAAIQQTVRQPPTLRRDSRFLHCVNRRPKSSLAGEVVC